MADRRAADGGFVTAQVVVAVGLSLLFLVLVANLLVVGYARGVVRAALDEGVRAGARAPDPAAECEARAAAVLRDLLGGPLGAGVEPVACTAEQGRVTAATRARFDGWLPASPSWTLELEAVAVRRGAP